MIAIGYDTYDYTPTIYLHYKRIELTQKKIFIQTAAHCFFSDTTPLEDPNDYVIIAGKLISNYDHDDNRGKFEVRY